MSLSLGCSKRKYRSSSGFSIIEIIVVIIVIGILAAVVILSYIGVTQKAKSVSLQSDLSDASTALKVFQAHNDKYPITVSTNCNASPDTTTNKCIRLTNGNAIVGYSANNSSIPQTFLLIAGNGTLNYKITNSSPSTQLAQTMQPGVTPGATVELHAAEANGGTGPGINAPLTTTWTDTSGNNNNGSLSGFTGSPWSGVGTLINPYKLAFNGTDLVNLPDLGISEDKTWTMEAWAVVPSVAQSDMVFVAGEAGPWDVSNYPITTLGILWPPGTNRAGMYIRDGLSNTAFPIGPAVNLTDGAIHHLVGVCDGSTATVYLDAVAGTPVSVASLDLAHLNVTATQVGASGGSQYLWPGAIIAVRLYPFPLTPAQINANYAAGVDW